MLTRIWTGFLLSGLCASLVALVVVYMHEKGVYPFRDAWSRLGRQPWGRRIAIAAFVVGMWVYASVKPGDGGSGGDGGGDGGGTNNIQMVIGPGGLPQVGFARCRHEHSRPRRRGRNPSDCWRRPWRSSAGRGRVV